MRKQKGKESKKEKYPEKDPPEESKVGQKEKRREGGRRGQKQREGRKGYAWTHKTVLLKRGGFTLRGNFKKLFSLCTMLLPTVYTCLCAFVQTLSQVKSTYGIFL